MGTIEKEYNAALDYLYSFVDYSLKHSDELAKAEFNLDRMRALMQHLGDPQRAYPILHVAGTKGKGSVSALAASGLQAAGYRVGLYTSPHLLDYCERIRVDSLSIPHQDLAALVELIKPAVAAVPKLTTFEITTALAFLHFARAGVSAAVVEVGLGGRLDATNIVMPKLSVITSLSYDHMAVLGNTLAQIAGEKAGIIKEGVPVVSSPQQDEALRALQRVSTERHSSFTLVGTDVPFRALDQSLAGQQFAVGQAVDELQLTIPLLGAHQVQNAATAAVALRALRQSGLAVPDQAIQAGFRAVRWRGRFEIAQTDPVVIFDSAHNQDSFFRLAETLRVYFPGRQAYLIFGASEDKNVPGMLAEMRGIVKEVVVTRADHPRALDPEHLAKQAQAVGLAARVIPRVADAFRFAVEKATSDDLLVLSAGSMFVTAEVMSEWHKMHPEIPQ